MRPTSDLDRLLTLVGALVETLRPSHGRMPSSRQPLPCLHCRLVVAYDQLTAEGPADAPRASSRASAAAASPAGPAVSPPPAGPAAPTPGAPRGGRAPGPTSIREVLAELRLSTTQAVQILATTAPETFGPLGPADLLDLEGADLVLAIEILRADAGGEQP